MKKNFYTVLLSLAIMPMLANASEFTLKKVRDNRRQG